MITFHARGSKAAVCSDLSECASLTSEALWIDLLEPTNAEETALEQALGIDVPTRDEMQDIATSSRLYKQGDALFMTATILTQSDSPQPEASAVLFVLLRAQLITVRYARPHAFEAFKKQRDANPAAFDSPASIFEGLTDTVVERIADILEEVGAGLDQLSHEVFATERRSAQAFRAMLERLGRLSDLTSKARESLLSLSRLFWFFDEQDKAALVGTEKLPTITGHVKTMTRDVSSLSDHATFLAGKVSFLLDAILGLINVEQNAIIKIFSVAAVVFLPPTLVASIYGMNFDHMPELRWPFGYPFAILLMIAAAILPFYFFKRKGWL